MASPLGNKPQDILLRRVHVSELYMQGQTMAEIPGQVGVSVAMVYKDVCWAREQWRTRAADAIEKHKERELAKIDAVEVEAWKGWQRTIGYYVTTTVKSTTVKTGASDGDMVELPGLEETKKKEKLAGDPRFLDIIHRCICKRCDILGLDAPKTLTGPGGGPLSLVFTGVQPPPWSESSHE